MKYQILLAIILCAAFVSAENVYREFNYSSPEERIYWYNYPYWIEANETGTLYVSNYDTATTNYAHITLAGGNATNMTYLPNNLFRAYVTSSTEEDVAVEISIYSQTGNLLANATDLLRFRAAFDVDLEFYKNNNNTNTEVEAYDNEFQYALLRYHLPGEPDYSYTLKSGNTLSWLNAIGRLLPYYEDVGTDQALVTDEVYLWARLDNGVATVQMYENGTYDLWTLNANVYGGLSSPYEFGRPIANGENQFRTTVVDQLVVDNETSTSYSIFISAWQVYKWHLIKNIAKIVFALVVWAFSIVALSFLCVFWIRDSEMRGKAFYIVLSTFALATSPILIMAIGMLL